MSMPAKEAHRLLANHLIASALDAALGADNVGWEDYPEIGEYDFERVVAQARSAVAAMRPTDEAFKAAYAALAARAEVDS